MSNPYLSSNSLSTQEFISNSYVLMLKKVKFLKELESKKKKNKLPLPFIKLKFDETSKLLEALRLLQNSIDYNNQLGIELSGVINDLGLYISKGNIAKTTEEAIINYDIAIIILESFIFKP